MSGLTETWSDQWSFLSTPLQALVRLFLSSLATSRCWGGVKSMTSLRAAMSGSNIYLKDVEWKACTWVELVRYRESIRVQRCVALGLGAARHQRKGWWQQRRNVKLFWISKPSEMWGGTGRRITSAGSSHSNDCKHTLPLYSSRNRIK